MKTRRILAALLTVPLVAAVLGGIPAQAAPNPQLTVTDVKLGTTAVTVSGLELKPVEVTVKAGYRTTDPRDDDLVLNVYLKRTDGTGQARSLWSTNLKRTAGTVQDGTWTGPLEVPSTANGKFTVAGVSVGPYGPSPSGMEDDPTPFDGQTLTVVGTHQPTFTNTTSPNPVPVNTTYKLIWRLTDSATGRAYGSRVKVIVANDSGCAEGGWQSVLTDVNGYVSTTVVPNSGLNCVYIPTATHELVWGNELTNFLAGVSAAPSKTSAKVGTLVPVNGTVTSAPPCKVNLQRLYGATQWRTVGTANIRTSGRFTLTAQPAYVGKIPYRVLMPACLRYVAASSKPFTITGVR
ncbi:hypothetical protein ACI2LF_04860 [Kribbella sp. NPDC020789]